LLKKETTKYARGVKEKEGKRRGSPAGDHPEKKKKAEKGDRGGGTQGPRW